MFSIAILLFLSFFSVNCITYTDLQQNFAKHLMQNKSQDSSLYDFQDLVTQYNILNNEKENIFEQLSNAPALNVSLPCMNQLLIFLPSIKNKEQWALRVIDAYGKPQSGILNGATKWMGQFSECSDSVNPANADWQANYCKVQNPTATLQDQTAILLGICMPRKCTPSDIANIVNFGVDSIPENITNLLPFKLPRLEESYINCHSFDVPFSSGAIIAIFIITVLVLFTIAGTTYDCYKTYEKKMIIEQSQVVNESEEEATKKSEDMKSSLVPAKEQEIPIFFQIIMSFSAYTNLRKLFTINKTADQLDCLNGIRFLSMTWVVLGHTYAFSAFSTSNPLSAYTTLQRFSFSVVSNAFFSVDTFFLLSGLLTSYLFMKEMAKRNGNLSVNLMVKFYVHRIWRITPPYMLCVMVAGCLTQYLGTGPNYPNTNGLDPNCKTKWWTNLLYINNFVSQEKQCFGIAWYLANDMQFHWFSPLLLIPFAFGKKALGYILSAALLIVNIVVTALVINADPGSELGTFASTTHYFVRVYVTPWCRMGPFIVGVLAGYIIYKCKNNPQFKLDKMLNIIGWLVSLFSLALMLFGYWPNFETNPAKHLNRVENILYQSTSRIIWAAALAFIIFSCVMKKGGFINDMLSWPVWTPLSRLSFSAYLVHMTVLTWYISIQEQTSFYQDINTVFTFFGILILSYSVALVVSLLFEIPLLGLEKFIFGKRK